MKAASLKELKSAIEQLPHEELVLMCTRLIKFKKENKELASYLLFDEGDETVYVKRVQDSLEELFGEVHKTNPYFAKKTIRKIVRVANKFIKYSNEKTTEVEILIFVAEQFLRLHLDMRKSAALQNIYLSLLKKLDKLVSTLHEDLQYDYLKQMKRLNVHR